jgi:hypothetical protein
MHALMNAIDLSTGAPREPRASAGNVTFLPRTIDKARASLPGGNLGEYGIDGMSENMFDHLAISRDAFISAVSEAAHDDEVVVWVRNATTQEKIDNWNTFAAKAMAFNGDTDKIADLFPWFTKDSGQSLLVLDLLHEDDRRAFA